jgi:predicted ATPase
MLKRLYADNYKCLVNFEFKMDEDEDYAHSCLFIGKNGSGKSSFAEVLRLFQSIGRGRDNLRPVFVDNRAPLPPLLGPDCFPFGKADAPMRFEIDVDLAGHAFAYTLSLELPPRFEALRVRKESLVLDGAPLFERDTENVQFRAGQDKPYTHDWHSVYLPAFMARNQDTRPLVDGFKNWLGSMLILAPIPQHIRAELRGKSAYTQMDAENLPDWFSDMVERNFDAYESMKKFIRECAFPDFQGMGNESDEFGRKFLRVKFASEQRPEEKIRFDQLSDGEKCLFLAGVVLIAEEVNGPFLCFWDEPDDYLAISEVQHFIAALKRVLSRRGQVIMTSHNPETTMVFSENNTFVFYREDHLTPTRNPITVAQWRKAANFSGNFVAAWTLGDVAV